MAIKATDTDQKSYIEMALTKDAKKWFHLSEEKIDNFETFEEIFKNRYWSTTIQRENRSRVESGIYCWKRDID